MSSQLKKGVVEHCVLKLLSKEDLSTYEIIEKLLEYISVNQNTIYPLLRRLINAELLESYSENSKVGAPRKYFKITTKGVEHLNALDEEWKLFINGVSKILGGVKNE